MKWTPLSLQKDALDFIMNKPKTGLLASPGLGKTAVVLTAIKTLLARRPEKKVLIVLTKKVLDSEGWQRECLKWDHLNGIKITPIVGSPAERAAILANLPTITCINYELLPWLLELTAAKWPWNLVVLDEAHRTKAYNGRWFAGKPAQYEKDVITGKRKKIADMKPGLIHVAPKTERWINMSGTPSPHSIADMWSQTHLLDGGRRLGHNITAFRNNWMRQGRDGFSWEAQPGAAEEIGHAVGDICLSIKARDYLDLPELVSNVVDIVMPPKIKAQYKFLEDEFFAKLKDGEIIEAANAAVLSGKCMQFSNGFLYREDHSWEDIHNTKLDALEDLLDEIGGPAIVTYQYNPADLKRILSRFPKAVVFDGSKGCIKAFAEGKIKTLLLHPGSAAEGVDGLQDGTDTIVFYSMTWNAGQHDQVIERIGPTRQLQSGHPRPVFVHYLATRGTVDMLALKRIKDKQTMQEIITEAMKERK